MEMKYVALLEAEKSGGNKYNRMGHLPVITENGRSDQLQAKHSSTKN